MHLKALILGAFLLPLASAHEGTDNLPDPLIPLYIAGILTVLVLIYSVAKNVEKFSPREKLICFWLIALPVLLASLFLMLHTLYDTTTSETKGPVHWHADYEVWFCGEKLDLINPQFPKNKIGSPLLHEHNDDRIHVEGTVAHLETITLGRYFSTIGGALTPAILSYPTNTGLRTVETGERCPNTTLPAMLKVYVNGKQITNPASYLLYPTPLIPPGDCIIVEFDESTSPTTNKICTSWQVKGVTYENLDRPNVTIGETTWQ